MDRSNLGTFGVLGVPGVVFLSGPWIEGFNTSMVGLFTMFTFSVTFRLHVGTIPRKVSLLVASKTGGRRCRLILAILRHMSKFVAVEAFKSHWS